MHDDVSLTNHIVHEIDMLVYNEYSLVMYLAIKSGVIVVYAPVKVLSLISKESNQELWRTLSDRENHLPSAS